MSATTDPRPVRWTSEEYYRLCEEGHFNGRRVQLIGGEIIEMPAQKNEHLMGVKFLETALDSLFGPSFWVRAQCSLDLSPLSVPDPDVAVVPGSPRSYRGMPIPTTALLVVEVSDTTLRYDQTTKMSLYAASGIADYWILNLVDRHLEVYRDPVPDPAQPFGHRYDSVTVLGPGAAVSPLAAPGGSGTVAVDDVLP